MNKLFHLWRILATGLSFSLFGLGGLFLRFAVFPTIRLLVWNREKSIQYSRQAVRYSFLGFIHMVQAFGVFRFEIKGKERLNRKGLLIVANHPSLIDIVFLIAFVKHATCIVKSGLLNNIFTNGPIRAAGYIGNDDAEELVSDCAKALKEGSNLIIFPEGTRTRKDGVIRTHRGAAHIALRSQCNITPVLIRCEPRMLTKNTQWWKIPEAPSLFTIDVQNDIIISSYTERPDPLALLARHLNHDIEVYFNEEIQKNAPA
ncbi:MAG: 1-acyl-sn-glycerol-3-phosphate acyltransferase [Burkholderiales bacterium]|jgi:1-acyl-sn-glycerol-3-phosphate acyltransferase|nr:1-acyl-sn-glycerol-3-phosphate acyltransferase [Burkholderiales bacterium]